MPADLDPHHELPQHPEFLELPLPEKMSFLQIMIFGLVIFGLVVVTGTWMLNQGSPKRQPESVPNSITAETSPPSTFSPYPSPSQMTLQPYPETDFYSNSLFNYSFSHSPELTIRSAYDQSENRTDQYDTAQRFYFDDRDEIEEDIVSVAIGGQMYGKEYDDVKEVVEDNFRYISSSTANYLSPENNRTEGPYSLYVYEGSTSSGRNIETYKYVLHWQDDPSYSEGRSGSRVLIFVPIELGDRSAGMGTYRPFKFLTFGYELENEVYAERILTSLVIRPE